MGDFEAMVERAAVSAAVEQESDAEQAFAYRKVVRAALTAAGVPELARKAQGADELRFELANLRALYDERTAYVIVHKGAALACSDAMRQAYSDQTVELDALKARVEAGHVGSVSQVEWEDSDRIVLHIEKDEGDVMMWAVLVESQRVRLLAEPQEGEDGR